MMNIKTKDKLVIVVTGGSGRFGKVFRKIKTKNKIYFPSKKQLNILSLSSIERYIKRIKPDILVHMAALSRPMEQHDLDIVKSIKLNIIGTANVTICCSKFSIKLIYISTNFVYPGTKGNYNEKSNLNPINNYAWSKLGGESSVKMYKNSLILRVCTTEQPFVHTKTFTDVITNFEYHNKIGSIIFKLLNEKGIINVGGKSQSVYKFAKSKGLKTTPIKAKRLFGKNYPTKQDMNLKKLNNILNKF